MNSETYLHGGEAGRIQENTISSMDVDTQCKLPYYTDQRDVKLLVERIYHYFLTAANLSKEEFDDNKILKVTCRWDDAQGNRFYTLSFKGVWGTTYDFSIVTRLGRDFLFYHDASKIPLSAVLIRNITPIIPSSLLKNGVPQYYRENKIIDTDNPETINFPGCVRLISNYVKGYVCKEETLERTLIDSLFTQLVASPKNDLKKVILHDITEHHKRNYAQR